jgi:hypothetical protein
VVCDCLERVFFPAYGTPVSVVTDNAKVFRCKQVRDLCFRWGITHITATPDYPKGSLAERVNRNLKSALKIFHHESQATWDEDLPWLGLCCDFVSVVPVSFVLLKSIVHHTSASWSTTSKL